MFTCLWGVKLFFSAHLTPAPQFLAGTTTMRLYPWFAFSIVIPVQCIVPFRCELYRGEYAVCTRHATPDEVKDGKGADLMGKFFSPCLLLAEFSSSLLIHSLMPTLLNPTYDLRSRTSPTKGRRERIAAERGSMGMTIMFFICPPTL
ncbi:hypothetical protein H4Q26_014050 [Puccinia striiformis f. sp. tritici PST-130]|nr:hypothetical protein H4Q26_014050 [Puccinia striiformis f. sp. tritici PST-130]